MRNVRLCCEAAKKERLEPSGTEEEGEERGEKMEEYNKEKIVKLFAIIGLLAFVGALHETIHVWQLSEYNNTEVKNVCALGLMKYGNNTGIASALNYGGGWVYYTYNHTEADDIPPPMDEILPSAVQVIVFFILYFILIF